MSYRGPRESFSENESEPEILIEEEIAPSKIHTVSIKPARLVVTTNTNFYSSNNFNKMTTPNMMANNATISEIKEFLEMIPVFRGEPELLSLFIRESEKIIKYFYDANVLDSPRNDFITSRIRSKIQGEAALYIANKSVNSWDELRASLITAYADKRDDATLAVEIVKLQQGNDTPFDFYKKIQKLLNAQIGYANLNYGMNIGLNEHFQRVALKTLLNGLNDPLGSLMRTKDPQNLETALNLLTNTYQKEINSQKFNKNFNTNQNNSKPRLNFAKPANNFVPNFNPSFMIGSPRPQNYQPINQSNNPPNQNFGNGFNRGQPMKRAAPQSQNFNQRSFPRSNFHANQETPMSISTNNTYRPPMKVQSQPNYHAHEVYNIENENLDQMTFNEMQYKTEENDYTPYNNFLGQDASVNKQIS